MTNFFRSLLIVGFLALFCNAAIAQNCTVNAGVNTSICPGSPFIVTGSASGLFASGGTAVWSQISGPTITLSATTISGSNATATVTGYAAGTTYGFRLTGKCTDGSLVYQDVQYTASNATQANAGPDVIACPGTFTFAANAPGTGETGSWTRVSGLLPVPANSPNASITLPKNSEIGPSVFQWTITNGSCISSDLVTITNTGGTFPVSAGPDQTIGCYTTTASTTLQGSYEGNGSGGQNGIWTFISGPSTPSFTPGNATAVISNLIQGSYTMRFTATGPCVNGTDDVILNVGPASQSVTTVANTSATYCDGRTSTILTGPSPVYTNETASWTQTPAQASAGVIIQDPSSPTTTISGLNGTTGRTFVYTITNSVTGCSNSATYTIGYTVPPSVIANGGASTLIAACDASTISIPYTVAGGNTTQWALVSGPAGSTLGGSTGTTAYATASASPQIINGLSVIGTYVIRFKRTSTNASGGCSDAYQDVSVSISKSVTAANAGTKQVLACNVFNTNLQGNSPSIGSGIWSQIAGPNTATFANPAVANTAISGLVSGAYTFRWLISGGYGTCGTSQADVAVIVSSPSPTTSAAGTNTAACYATPVQLQGNQPAVNETGTWTVSPSAGVVFNNVNAPNAIVTGLSNNTAYTFTWKIANSCGSSSSSVVITTSSTAGPQQATAGPDQCLSSGTTHFTLAGNAPASGETGIWTLLTGAPNNPTFTNSNSTAVTGAVNGTYGFEWSLAKGGCTVTRDTVVITISAAATTATAGTSLNQCGFTDITLNGNNPAIGTGLWTQSAGPGGAVINHPSQYNTTVSGLTVGRFIFRWTISNGACSSNFAEVTINISTPPTAAAAGADQSLCGSSSTTLAASAVTTGTGLWSVVSGPNSPTFSNPSSPASTITGLLPGTYVLKWSTSNGPYCPASSDNMTVFVTQNAAAGADQSLCSQSSTLLSGNEGSTGTWTQVGTTPTVATIATNSSNTAIASGLTGAGAYTFRYTIAAVGACPQTSDDLTVTVTPAPSAAQGGDDINVCVATSTTLTTVNLGTNGTAPTSGTGTWSVQTKPTGSATPTFSNLHNINSTFGNLIAGSTGIGYYVLVWNVTNGSCTTNEDIVKVTLYTQPSAANAGPDQNAACSAQITLSASTPAVGLGTWTQTAGPVLPAGSITAPNAPTTTVSNTSAGNSYTFTWSVVNGTFCTAKTDDVIINVVAGTPTTASAGSAQTLCNQFQTLLAANTPASGETGTWSVTSKPVSAPNPAFTSLNDPQATISGLQQGSYTLTWTISNAGTCTSAASVPIAVSNAPTTANAGPDASYCLFNPVALAATPVTSGTGAWTILSKPPGAPDPVFSSTADPAASLNGLVEGAYSFQWTASNGSCPVSTDQVTLTVYTCQIGVTKASGTPVLQTNGTYNVTFTFNVTNTGSSPLSGVQVTDDLHASFPGKTFTISTLSASSGLSVNSAFTGTGNTNLLNAASSSLPASGTGSITLTVNITL